MRVAPLRALEESFIKIGEVQIEFLKNITAPILWYDQSKDSGQNFPNGTVTFLKRGENLFAVSCGHIYKAYLKAKQEVGENFVSKILNLPFNFKERLVGYNEDLDLATFEISYDEIKKIDAEKSKTYISQIYSFDPSKLDGVCYIAGWPEEGKRITPITLRDININCGVVVLSCHFDSSSSSDRDISFNLDANRNDWIPLKGDNLEIIPKAYPCSGMSGGAVVVFLEQPNSRIITPYLMGIIYEGPNGKAHHSGIGMNIIKATRATFFSDDGTLIMPWLP